jgi:hypothetical protein
MFKNLRSLRILATVLVGVSEVAALIWFAVPRPSGAETSQLYSPLGAPLSIFDALIALGGALLFFLALKNFRPELKSAYRFIAIAQLVIGLGAMLFPYVEYYNLWTTVPILTLFTYAGYFFGSILMFLGARKFYRILGFRSKVASIWFIIGLTLLAWGLHAFLPHAPVGAEQGLDEMGYDIFEIVSVLPLVFYGGALYLVWQLYQKTGSGYKKIFTWLTIGIGLQLVAALNTAILEVIGYHNWYFASRLYIIPAILADIGIFWAAYQFNAFGLVRQKPPAHTTTAASSVDVILYLASSVADRRQIDGYLDGMRTVTAQLQEGQTPDAQQQQELLRVYLQIEDLLLTKDKLRAFDREDLRNDLNQRFNLEAAGTATFWPLLKKRTA